MFKKFFKKEPIELLKEKQKEMQEKIERISAVIEGLEKLDIRGYEKELWTKISKLKNSPGSIKEIEHLLEEITKQREKERKEIEKLASEINQLIEKVTPGIKKPEFLAALKVIIELELPKILQQFQAREIFYPETKENLLTLQEQVKILSTGIPEEESYYQILEVSEDASQEEIKKAYIEKIKDYHPDQFQGSKKWIIEKAVEMTKRINEAYVTLGDPQKRKEYDEKIGIRR